MALVTVQIEAEHTTPEWRRSLQEALGRHEPPAILIEPLITGAAERVTLSSSDAHEVEEWAMGLPGWNHGRAPQPGHKPFRFAEDGVETGGRS